MNEQTVRRRESAMAEQMITELDRLLVEMRKINEVIRGDQIEIDRLKLETREIANHTDLVLSRLNSHLDRLAATS
jgi:hypothetical protein